MDGIGKGSIVHGFARLRLVGTTPIDGMEECPKDDLPQPLPFPSCVRDFSRRSRGNAALDALDRVNFSLDKLRRELEQDSRNDDGPRAA